MVRSKRLLFPMAVVCVIGVFLIAFLYFAINREEEGHLRSALFYETELLPADLSMDANAYIGEEYVVSEEFSSNLPILLITLNSSDDADDESGTLSIYSWENQVNNLHNSPIQSIPVELRTENTSTSTKPDLTLSLTDEKGDPQKVSILGMAADSEWELSSLRKDKSMLRTYTAYRTASKILTDVPRVAYCEVLTEKDGIMYYQGLYQIREKIDVGINRIEIDAPDPDMTRNDYLLVSDTTRQGPLLATRQIGDRFTRGYTSLIYPTEDELSRAQFDYIEQDYLTIAERIADNDDYAILIDVGGLIDYYVVNMYFGNTDVGKKMMYMYNTVGGVMEFGPIYDFDLSMGNVNGEGTDPEDVEYEEQLFLSDLMNDNTFVTRFLSRLVELRRTVLNDDVVYPIIDETQSYLAAAIQRDDNRWRPDETSDGVHAIYRSSTLEPTEYELDLYRIKAYLTSHGGYIHEVFSYVEEIQRIASYFEGGNTLLFIVSMILFFIPSILVNRKG